MYILIMAKWSAKYTDDIVKEIGIPLDESMKVAVDRNKRKTFPEESDS